MFLFGFSTRIWSKDLFFLFLIPSSLFLFLLKSTALILFLTHS